MLLKYKCPHCQKSVHVQSQFPVGNKLHTTYSCGHLELILVEVIQDPVQLTASPIKKHDPQTDNSFKSIDGEFEAYDYQKDGIAFFENTDLNGLLADAMGLGKTIQALCLIKRNPLKMCPVLIVVPASLKFQWAALYHKWVSNEFSSIIPVMDRTHLIPGFQVYIVSQDFLARKNIVELICKLKPKSIIIDECQGFKDSDTKRAKALIKIVQDCKIVHRIPMSGTPIKNRAAEYFTVLNLLDPLNFSSPQKFKKEWLMPNEKGVYTRIMPFKLEKFKELTSKYILRREKHEVLKNLPPLRRDFQLIEITDPLVKDSYNSTLDLFKNYMNTCQKIESTQILGWLAKLRRITGQAKCPFMVEWAEEFLESTDENLAIGIQHHSVRDSLFYALQNKGYNPLKLSGEDNAWAKDRIIRRFNAGESRIMILNQLAGGIGLNLQSCANCVNLERMWNPADEEQFIGRFHRDGQKKAVTATYIIAQGTIDEFFHSLIASKYKISEETGIALTNEVDQWFNNTEFLKEFAEFVINKKLA